METRARDLATVESLIRARAEVLATATAGDLVSVFATEGPGAETYVVKVLDVVPGLGKVAGRRLMNTLHIDHSVRIGELSDAERAAILAEVNS